MIKHCTICGGSEFEENIILWPALINEWQLSDKEVNYVNRQQGCQCRNCGSNLRSMALAQAILTSFDFAGNFQEFVNCPDHENLAVLEINEAGNLTPLLKNLPNHKIVTYPEVDMTQLPMSLQGFDLVVHSDTLEHIEFPVTALNECRRILSDRGRCIFTVPIIVDRFSRSRHGLAPSYHGSPGDGRTDYLVHTEFGADVWRYVLEAGFQSAAIHCVEFPSAIAIEARR